MQTWDTSLRKEQQPDNSILGAPTETRPRPLDSVLSYSNNRLLNSPREPEPACKCIVKEPA